jgi:predicted DNA-binding antitoxin AbrB/MazE fold protein
MMKSIRAVYENGIFRPLEPVDLPDRTTVTIAPQKIEDDQKQGMDAIYEILSRRYQSGHHDTAERHNEHQP